MRWPWTTPVGRTALLKRSVPTGESHSTLELQPFRPSAGAQRFDAPVKLVSASVKNHPINPRRQGSGRQCLPDQSGSIGLVDRLGFFLDLGGKGRSCRQRLAKPIVDDLGIDMAGALEHTQAWAFRAPDDTFSYPTVPSFSARCFSPVASQPKTSEARCGLRAGLPSLTANPLVGVLDPLALIRLRGAATPEVGRDP